MKIFYLNRTEDIAHTIGRAGDNTHVVRSQSSQSGKLNFLTLPDVAFSFINKRSGYEIRIGPKNGRKTNILRVYIIMLQVKFDFRLNVFNGQCRLILNFLCLLALIIRGLWLGNKGNWEST